MHPVATLAVGLKRGGSRLLDIVLPPRCLKCGTAIDAVGAMCADCWPDVAFLAPPHCAACGLPFEFDLGPEALCGACARERPVFARARAAFRYEDGSKDLILRFKHADRTDAAPAFARWMARAGDVLVADADLIAPVPLHWLRLFARRYNQAALLASALGALSGGGGRRRKAASVPLPGAATSPGPSRFTRGIACAWQTSACCSSMTC
jgi:predicted amidophosphoribosyltransferase